MQEESRAKILSAADLQYLKKTTCSLKLPTGDQVFYLLVEKKSQSGISSNDRLIILNQKDRYFGYVSKVPEGLIPFRNEEEVNKTRCKERIWGDQVRQCSAKQFKCAQVQDTPAAFGVMINRNKQFDWVFLTTSPTLAQEWVKRINDCLTREPQKPPPPPSPPKQYQNTLYEPLQRIEPQRIPLEVTQVKEPQIQTQLYRIPTNKQPFTDLASELKYLHQTKPSMFKSDNQQSTQQLYSAAIEAEPKYNVESVRPPSTRHLGTPANLRADNSKASLTSDKEYQLVGSRNYLKSPVENNFFIKKPSREALTIQTPKEEEFQMNTFIRSSNSPVQSKQYAPQYAPQQLPNEPIKHFSKRRYNRRKWNEQFVQKSNKLQIYDQFIGVAKQLSKRIIDGLSQKQKEYTPTQHIQHSDIYEDDGVIVQLHVFEGRPKAGTIPNSPVLYDQRSMQQMKRQFYNYNLVLSVTGNEGMIKVPLCVYFEYKGMLAVCRAEVPEGLVEVSAGQYEQQFAAIQNKIKVRFPFGAFSCYSHSKYLFINNLTQLIPQVPHFGYFRKEMLLRYEAVVEDQDTCQDAAQYVKDHLIPQFVAAMEYLELNFVNSRDLQREMHNAGLSMECLGVVFQHLKHRYLKRVIASEIVAIVFNQILRSEISDLLEKVTLKQSVVLLDCCHMMLNDLFSYSRESLWPVILQQAQSSFHVLISKQDIIPGYLLSAILTKCNLQADFSSDFDRNIRFFLSQNTIPRQLLTGFTVHTRRYDPSSFSSLAVQIQQSIYNSPSPQRFHAVMEKLNLKEQQVPSWLQYIQPQLLAYFCNFVPYSQHQQFQHIGVYNMLVQEPHSWSSARVSLLAVKWCVKKQLLDQAIHIFEHKCAANSFWSGEFNVQNGQLYDFFAMYYASEGKYDEAVQLAKCSLLNTINVLSQDALPVADKHYQLGNIYFKMARKEDAFREYLRTRHILQSHQETKIPQFALILLKLSLLHLTFGNLQDAIQSALEALHIFEMHDSCEQDQLQSYEVLARGYEVTHKDKELRRISELCAVRFNQTNNAKIFQRMAKISLYPVLSGLGSSQAKATLSILTKLRDNSDTTHSDAFNFLKKKGEDKPVMQYVVALLENVLVLADQIHRKDLFRRHRSLEKQPKSEAQDLLIHFDALGGLCGYNFLIGGIRTNQY